MATERPRRASEQPNDAAVEQILGLIRTGRNFDFHNYKRPRAGIRQARSDRAAGGGAGRYRFPRLGGPGARPPRHRRAAAGAWVCRRALAALREPALQRARRHAPGRGGHGRSAADGAGLGLWLVSGTMQRLGGHIRVTNRSRRGALIELTFPFMTAGESRRRPSSEKPGRRTNRKRRGPKGRRTRPRAQSPRLGAGPESWPH